MVGHEPNFSPSSPIVPIRSPVVGGVLAEVVDDLLDVAERDPIAEALLRAEDPQELALVVGRVGAPVVLLADGCRPEVGVVEDRPVVAAGDQRGRQVRLPDPFGEPRPARPAAEQALQLRAHPLQLPDPVALRERRQDRLEVATAEHLDLVAGGQRRQPLDELGSLQPQPFEQRTAVVERQADGRMTLEGLDHRQVRLVVDLRQDPPEVADRLMVVDRQGERDPGRHRGGQPASVTAGAGTASTGTPAAGR